MDAKFFRKNVAEDRFDIHIDRNGQWFHQGAPMKRVALAKLFATVLHYDIDRNEYWLVTPHEQGRITVEDVPYVIVDCDIQNKQNIGDVITVRTNLDEVVEIGPENALVYDHEKSLPYVVIRNNARARLNRQTRQYLIEHALNNNGMDDATGALFIHSHGKKFVIADMNEGGDV